MKNVNYVHFDNKMSKKEANNYLRNISNHQYLPFINYEIDKKKWDSNHNKTGETRTISVASVKDNYVYQYFNNIISNKYEKFIKSFNINDCVCAYRKGQHKSNVNYSAEVFKFIADSNDAKIFIGDVTKFFDNLDHKILKNCLKEVLNVKELDDNTYNMLKSLEKSSYIEIDDILKFLNSKGVYIHTKIYDNDNKFSALCLYCEIRDIQNIVRKEWFKELKDSYLKPGKDVLKNKTKGIVQGSSISGTLSNVYMINVDKKIDNLLSEYEYIYRRYCDDFIVVIRDISNEKYNKIIEDIKEIISNAKLELKDSKIQKFDYKNGKVSNLNGKKEFIQFLGFELHNDNIIKVRQSTMDRQKNKILKNRKRYKLIENDNIKKAEKIKMYKKLENVTGNDYAKYTIGSYISKAVRIFDDSDNLKKTKMELVHFIDKHLK